MIVYIAAFVVVVLVLLAAYRSLGAPATAISQGPGVLDSVQRSLEEALETITAVAAPLPDAAHEARRVAAGAAARLAAMEVDEGRIRARRDLLGAAAEDCGWAGRMMESDGYPGNPGLAAAAAALLDHARRCLTESAHLDPSPEPVDPL